MATSGLTSPPPLVAVTSYPPPPGRRGTMIVTSPPPVWTARFAGTTVRVSPTLPPLVTAVRSWAVMPVPVMSPPPVRTLVAPETRSTDTFPPDVVTETGPDRSLMLTSPPPVRKVTAPDRPAAVTFPPAVDALTTAATGRSTWALNSQLVIDQKGQPSRTPAVPAPSFQKI